MICLKYFASIYIIILEWLLKRESRKQGDLLLDLSHCQFRINPPLMRRIVDK